MTPAYLELSGDDVPPALQRFKKSDVVWTDEGIFSSSSRRDEGVSPPTSSSSSTTNGVSGDRVLITRMFWRKIE
jgi:hypothetical protein